MKLKRFYELEQDIIAEIERLALRRRQTRTAVIETAILVLAEQDKNVPAEIREPGPHHSERRLMSPAEFDEYMKDKWNDHR